VTPCPVVALQVVSIRNGILQLVLNPFTEEIKTITMYEKTIPAPWKGENANGHAYKEECGL
jgi:hypothetical protein